MTPDDQIVALIHTYAERRRRLAEIVGEMQDKMDAVKRLYLAEIRAAVSDAADAQADLHAAVEAAPERFVKPRTVTVAGIRVGYMKQRGQVEWDDEAKVIARIRAQLPKDQADLLIRVKEAVHKPGVYDLTAGDLKRLGIRVTDDCDAVTIKAVDGEVDKLVNALLAEAERVELEEAA